MKLPRGQSDLRPRPPHEIDYCQIFAWYSEFVNQSKVKQFDSFYQFLLERYTDNKQCVKKAVNKWWHWHICCLKLFVREYILSSSDKDLGFSQFMDRAKNRHVKSHGDETRILASSFFPTIPSWEQVESIVSRFGKKRCKKDN